MLYISGFKMESLLKLDDLRCYADPHAAPTWYPCSPPYTHTQVHQGLQKDPAAADSGHGVLWFQCICCAPALPCYHALGIFHIYQVFKLDEEEQEEEIESSAVAFTDYFDHIHIAGQRNLAEIRTLHQVRSRLSCPCSPPCALQGRGVPICIIIIIIIIYCYIVYIPPTLCLQEVSRGMKLVSDEREWHKCFHCCCHCCPWICCCCCSLFFGHGVSLFLLSCSTRPLLCGGFATTTQLPTCLHAATHKTYSSCILYIVRLQETLRGAPRGRQILGEL